jgi:UDP:flavonoid glycosyltransferase YjiC (YdhE family)
VRAIITNFGSAGDVHPYLALIMELKRRGHDVAFAFSPQFRSAIEQHGVEFIPIGPDFQQTQYDIITTAVSTPNIDYSAEKMRDLFIPLIAALPQMFRELKDACADADVLISGPLQPASRMIHELTGMPLVSIQEAHFGGGGTLEYQEATTSLVNPFRAQFGLPPLRHPLTHDANSSQLALYAMSKHVMPAPPDWPPHYHMTGYFFFDDDSYQPDPDLLRFIESGEPPVAVTFGSMTHDDPQRVTQVLLEAIGRVGCRAIIQQGWSGLARCEMPQNVFAAGFVPHAWLFPRISCAVHHGGGGTAAAAFRAGAPSIFVPHAADQPLWAQLAHEMGLTVPPIPFLELTAESLADALKTTLLDHRYRQATAELNRKMKAERGVKTAADLIEQMVSKIGLREDGSEQWTDKAYEHGQSRQGKNNRRKLYQQQQRSKRREEGGLSAYSTDESSLQQEQN